MRPTCNLRFVLAGLMLTANPLAQADQQLDLQQALNYALQQNRTLALSALDQRSAQLAISGAESEFAISVRPEVSLNAASENRDASVYGINVSKRTRIGTELSARLLSEDVLDESGHQERVLVELQQPLFRFAGRLINEDAVVRASNNLRTTRRRYELQKIDLIVEVVRSYENILRLDRQLRADGKALERADTLYRSTRAKEALGRASRIDTLRVELQRGQALSRLENDRERLASAERDFAELLGFAPEEGFTLQPTKLLEVELPPLRDAVEIAFANRLEYAQALQDSLDAERDVRIANKQLQPDVRLVARYQRSSDSTRLGSGFDLSEESWFVGFTGDTDINRVRERNLVKQSQVGLASADQVVRVLELRIARELQQQVLAYRRAHAELKILERNRKHAAARLQLARRLFEIGRSDNFSVTDAEDSFLQAEGDLLFGRAQASISGYELLRSMGTLTETPADLRPETL